MACFLATSQYRAARVALFWRGGIGGNLLENGGLLTLDDATIQGNVQVNGNGAVSIGSFVFKLECLNLVAERDSRDGNNLSAGNYHHHPYHQQTYSLVSSYLVNHLQLPHQIDFIITHHLHNFIILLHFTIEIISQLD